MFWQFDNLVIVLLYGYVDVKDYYEKCSVYYFLKVIYCLIFILYVLDDFFMNYLVILQEQELVYSVIVELSEIGGYVGFMQGIFIVLDVWMY